MPLIQMKEQLLLPRAHFQELRQKAIQDDLTSGGYQPSWNPGSLALTGLLLPEPEMSGETPQPE